WLPQQFKTVGDYVKSFDETKAALTRAQQENASPKKGATPAAETPPSPQAPKTDPLQVPESTTQADTAATQAVAKAGLDVSEWQTEFSTTGDGSEEGRAAIAKGLEAQFGPNARQLVDEYVNGRKNTEANYRNDVFGHAGGEEKYNAMMKWAASSLTDAEK